MWLAYTNDCSYLSLGLRIALFANRMHSVVIYAVYSY